MNQFQRFLRSLQGEILPSSYFEDPDYQKPKVSPSLLHRNIKPENMFISERKPAILVLGILGMLSPVDTFRRGAGGRIYEAPKVYY